MATCLSAQTQDALKQWDMAVAVAESRQVAAAARDMFAALWEAGGGNVANELLARHLQPSPQDSDWVLLNLQELTVDEQKPRPKPQQADSHFTWNHPAPESSAQFLAAQESSAQVLSAQFLANLPAIIMALTAADANHRLEAARQLRKALSVERNPPVSQVIAAGALPILVNQLQDSQQPNIQFEAAWALTNIASGSSKDTEAVVQHGVVPLLVQLLSVENQDIVEQAVWALGNIAGDSAAMRNLVLRDGALSPILEWCLRDGCKLTMQRNATWTLSNLLRGKPAPPREVAALALPTLSRLLQSPDSEVMTDALWAISYAADGENERVQDVLQAGVQEKLVELLLHNSPSVQTPAVRAVGNIVSGNDAQTEALLAAQLLPSLRQLLSHPKRGIRKEVCWALSNITAGNPAQIQAVITAGLFPDLVRVAAAEVFEVRKEALWALSNATEGGTSEQLQHLVEVGLVPCLSEALAVDDSRILQVALSAIGNVLRAGHAPSAQEAPHPGAQASAYLPPYLPTVEALALPHVQALQGHANPEVAQTAGAVLQEMQELAAGRTG